MKVFVRMRKSHALRLVPGVNCARNRRARMYVACTRSSASASDRVMRSAVRYSASMYDSASFSKASSATQSLYPNILAIPAIPDRLAIVDRRRLRAIGRRLLRAYGTPPPARHLPPIEELVLTVLSQHTSDTNRDRAYGDLRRRLATWDDVADAPLPVLAGAIRRGGLGPTKAVRIRAMLRGIRDSGVPLDDRAFTHMADQALWDTLVALPGVGPKTAACVLLFSLDRPYFRSEEHTSELQSQ